MVEDEHRDKLCEAVAGHVLEDTETGHQGSSTLPGVTQITQRLGMDGFCITYKESMTR